MGCNCGSRCDAELGACGGRSEGDNSGSAGACGGGASKLVATRDTRGNYFFFLADSNPPLPPPVVVTRWHAFKVAARNYFGLRQPK